MAHFAKIVDGTVVKVIVIDNAAILVDGVENESNGIAEARRVDGDAAGVWKQCSYNGRIRKNYPGIGWKYSLEHDGFHAPQPFPSWTLDGATCRWVPPVARPEGRWWVWDEKKLEWTRKNP